MKTRIDLSTYPRRAHFEHFYGMSYPYVGMTAEVDVTNLLALCREKKYSFYLLVMHAVALAADEVPEFRRRIEQGGIVEYDECPTSHTELKADGTYVYCLLHHHMPLAEYIAQANAARQAAQESGTLEEEGDVLSLYFISCVPWVQYTALLQPVCCGEDSNPRITWGKYQTNSEGRVMMPLSVLVHHALADGLHIARFYEAFNKHAQNICNE